MDLLLINPFPEGSAGINEATIEPPLGLAYLAASARAGGFTVELLEANILRLPAEKVVDWIISANPACLGISTNIITHSAGADILRRLVFRGYRRHVIFGGPFPSSEPGFCLESTSASAVVVGEGEGTLLEVLRKLKRGEENPFRGTRGCVWRHPEGELIAEEPRPLLSDIDTLPMPAWDLLPPFNLYKSRARRRPVGALFTSRGCPFQCVFCNKNIFGSAYRLHSVDRVLAEVDVLVNRFGIKQLDFLDDALAVNLEWAKELFRRLEPCGLAINLQNGIRADCCDEELMELMRKAGVFKVSIGVESGNQDMQRRIKKNLDLEAVMDTTRWAKERGIVVYGNFILGLPYDTAATMEDTIDFSLRMDPEVANFMCMTPLPGTEAYDEIRRKGKLFFSLDELLSTGFYGSEAKYSLPGMDPEEVSSYYRKAYWRFYSRTSKIWNLARSIRSLGELKWILESAWGVLHLPRTGKNRSVSRINPLSHENN